jgi:hypothetical protein
MYDVGGVQIIKAICNPSELIVSGSKAMAAREEELAVPDYGDLNE